MISKRLKEKIKALRIETQKMFPENKTDLEYWNEFQLLIAIIMSAQTTDIQVNKANKAFFKVLSKPIDWIELWEDKIRNFIKTIGFYRNKAKNILKTCELLYKKHNSKIPETLEELQTLHWVWIKTAKVFLSVTKNAPYLAVDTHVHRVLNRVWIVKTKNALETDKEAERVFSEEDNARLHHSILFFWRYHCIARKPKCYSCPLTKNCDYKDKNLEEKKS